MTPITVKFISSSTFLKVYICCRAAKANNVLFPQQGQTKRFQVYSFLDFTLNFAKTVPFCVIKLINIVIVSSRLKGIAKSYYFRTYKNVKATRAVA